MQRRFDFDLIESFLRTPHKYRFFQAIRLLERWDYHVAFTRPQGGASGGVRRRYVNSTTLSFPPSEIEAARAYDHHGQRIPDDVLHAAIRDGGIAVIEIVPAFMGLLGAQGALPHQYSERLASTESLRRYPAARAFFDIFSDRLVALFHDAWKKYRLPLRHETQSREHYMGLLLALGGLGPSALRNRLRQAPGLVYDDALARYVSALRQRPMSAVYLGKVLANYFRVQLRIEQFMGRWYRLPVHAQTVLGSPGAVLGGPACVGERVWQRNLRMRVWIGPLRGESFNDFLPGGERAAALEKMLGLLTGEICEYEVRLIYAREDIQGMTLNGAATARLGWNTFLSTTPAQQDRADAAYELFTLLH